MRLRTANGGDKDSAERPRVSLEYLSRRVKDNDDWYSAARLLRIKRRPENRNRQVSEM